MKTADIRNMNNQEIEAKITELKSELLNLRFQKATGNLENTAQIKTLKKDVARMKTVLNEK